MSTPEPQLTCREGVTLLKGPVRVNGGGEARGDCPRSVSAGLQGAATCPPVRAMFPDTSRREPAITLPGLLVALIGILVAVHLLRGWLSDIGDLTLLMDTAFIPAQWTVAFGFADAAEAIREAAHGDDPDLAGAHAALARYVLEETRPRFWSFLSYAFLHGSWMHLILNSLWLAAFGTPVVRRLGSARTLALLAATAIAGAVAFWAVNPLGTQVVIGASASVSGLMGAAALFAFRGPQPSWDRAMPQATGLAGLLHNRAALAFLGVWFAVNLAVGLVAAPLGIVEGGIAWEAHIGGLLGGVLLFPLLDRMQRPEQRLP